MGKYTNPNFRCATKGCGHFVADHTNLDPKTEEIDFDAMIRYACHATGSGCTCTDYIDGGTEDVLSEGQAGAARDRVAKEAADAKKAAADAKAAAKAAATPAAPGTP